MLTILKLRFLASIVGSSFGSTGAADIRPTHDVTVTVYGPTSEGRYAVMGEGYLPTKSCTVTADGMTARVRGRFITFYDRDGQNEGQCELGTRPTVTPWHGTIRRPIATVGGK